MTEWKEVKVRSAAQAEIESIEALARVLDGLRKRLDAAFSPDTAAPGFPEGGASSGHCAAVAAIVYEMLGGEMISTNLGGHSHWLNRLRAQGRTVDVDVTGDQFGRPSVQVADVGKLYPGTRVRGGEELTRETLARARLLAERAGLESAGKAIERRLEERSAPSPGR